MLKTSDCDSILKMLIRTPSWNPHALFFVYITGLSEDWEALSTYIFTQFWNHFVINLTILVPDSGAKFSRVNTTFCLFFYAKKTFFF